MPFLSIIITAHNCELTLAETLESVKKAIDFEKDVEVIVLNDSSYDKTQQIIERYAETFSSVQIREVQLKNVGRVRNIAVQMARGEYITMVDGDDLLKPRSLRDAVVFLKQHRPDLLLTHLIETRNLSAINSNWAGFSPIKLPQNEAVRRFLIHKDFQAHLIGQFIRKDIYLCAPIPSMTCYEDFAVFPAFLMHSQNIWFQKEGHYHYVKRANSLSSVLDKTKIRHLINCTKRMERVFPSSFHWLVCCHWLDIYLKHAQLLTHEQISIVEEKIKSTLSPGFFMSPDVRLSYKKKAIQALWKR
ncbi:glycosyltransferase family 2 protein [Klebsiella sp. MISC125]|uniref:glycosyltransferase family 2 protein n=1 Tax=Klebsiella sp. MISC125 TaxID=2755386 RepID=UPI003DAA3558